MVDHSRESGRDRITEFANMPSKTNSSGFFSASLSVNRHSLTERHQARSWKGSRLRKHKARAGGALLGRIWHHGAAIVEEAGQPRMRTRSLEC